MAPCFIASLLCGLAAVVFSHEVTEPRVIDWSQGSETYQFLRKSHYGVDHLQPLLASSSPNGRFAYCICLATVATLLGVAYKARGIATCTGIVMYVLSLSLMSVSVKNVFSHGFEFPQFVTAFHFVSTATISCLILLLRDGS